MKYNNIILTIIAFCLIFNILKEMNIIPTANANIENNNTIDVNIKSVNGYSIFSRNVPVEVIK